MASVPLSMEEQPASDSPAPHPSDLLSGLSPLHHAGDLQGIQALVEQGASLAEVGPFGYSLLHTAAWYGSLASIPVLVSLAAASPL
jgi:hypothetical protein